MLKNIHEMAWASRLFYVLLFTAAVVNIYMAFAARMKAHWRFNFGYAGTVLSLYSIYVILRITNVFDRTDYAALVVWLLPLLVFPMIMPPLIIHWESRFYQEALKKLTDDSGEHEFR